MRKMAKKPKPVLSASEIGRQKRFFVSLMQMQGSKPECARGRTKVRSRRMNGAADDADAQNGKKAKARIERKRNRASKTLFCQFDADARKQAGMRAGAY